MNKPTPGSIQDQTAATREEAISTGTMYYQGVECINGHEGIRYAKSNNCLHCSRGNADTKYDKRDLKALHHAEDRLEKMRLEDECKEVWDE